MAVGRRKMKYDFEYFVFIFPAFFLFLIFFIIPFFSGIYYSLTSWNGISKHPRFVGIENYMKIFASDSVFWDSFANTLIFTAGHVILVNVFSFILALILTKEIRFKKGLRVVFFLPNVLSMVIIGQIWSFIFGQASSELGRFFGIGFLNSGWLTNPDIALYSVILASLWQAMGWYMLIYVAGLEAVPQEVIEASVIDGAGGFRRYISVIIPLVIPSVTICLFLTLTNSLRVFDIVYAMTQGGPGYATTTVILDIYNTSFNSFLYGYGTAKSVLFLFFILGFSLIQVYALKKREVQY